MTGDRVESGLIAIQAPRSIPEWSDSSPPAQQDNFNLSTAAIARSRQARLPPKPNDYIYIY